ncbi:MAG: CPBP family intramembrane glutamic endopeptidase [Pseudomonadota bacterium]
MTATRLSRIALFYGVLFTIGAIWATAQDQNLLLAIDVGPGYLLAQAALGLGVGLLTAWASQRLSTRFTWAQRLERALFESLGPFSASEALMVSLLSAIGEEALFRGAMQPVVGLVVTALAFGLLHVGPGKVFLPWTGMAIGAGFLFGGLCALTGNLIAPIAAHAAINFINLRYLSRTYGDEVAAQGPTWD